jgi:Ran GTPase-activating protein (RanGAP) involved in mRNA processing and transport
LKLEELDLSNNQIGDAGMANLATNETWSNLEVLMLFGNKFQDEGAASLAANKSWRRLGIIELSETPIGA